MGGEVTVDAVRDKITVIRAEKDRKLVFCLRDGQEIVKQWREHEIKYICTEEQKRKISLKNSGRKPSEEQRREHSRWMKEYWKTHEFTEERRKKQSESMKAYWNDPEASGEHRKTVSRLTKARRAKETSGKEEDNA